MEKYASNLIKESRPPYWRTVKFTSSLVQVHVGRLIGSRDILSQMGYTQDIQGGVAFPPNVDEPDVNRLRNLAPDLFLARYEIDALLVGTHPFYELDPPISRDKVQIPVLLRASHPPSRPQPFPPRVSARAQERQPQSDTGRPVVPALRNTSTGNQPSRSPSSPMPAARRQGNRDPGSPPDGKVPAKAIMIQRFVLLTRGSLCCSNSWICLKKYKLTVIFLGILFCLGKQIYWYIKNAHFWKSFAEGNIIVAH